MSRTPLGAVLRHIHSLAGTAAARRLTDLHLLRRFADGQDEDAFAEIMRRHGPLVLSVCRRVLGHEQDAEDAFQAAFLVLARKARSIRKGESVGSFLYGVAYRIAMKERGKLAHRRKREQQGERPTPAGPLYEAAFRELQMLLDEGVNRLPEKYRIPFVMCCLEGKSKSEAARELGWKEGTVSSRLAHGRKEIQQFLARKGVTLGAALTAASVAANSASGCVPPLLTVSVVRAAKLFASASSAVMESVQAVQMAESVLRSMAALPWKTATLLLVAVSLAVGGAGMAYHAGPAEQTAANEAPKFTANSAPKPVREEEKPRTDRYGDSLPDGALTRLGTIRFRQGYFTHQVAFSPDGKIVACAGAGRGLCLWDAATGKELRQITQMTHALSIALSPDGKRIACAFDGSKGGTAIYEMANGRKIRELSGPGSQRFLAYAPDGKTIAGTPAQGPIHFFDAATGANRKTALSCGEDAVYRMSWSPDSRQIAWVGKKGLIHLCDAVKGEEIAAWKGHDKHSHGVAFSPDGKLLATGGMDETIRLWDVATHKELHVLDGKHQYVRVVTFSHDGRMLASGHGDGTIALWDVENGRMLPRWQAHCFTVSSLDFSPDDKRLVSGAVWECGPRLWDVGTGTEVRPFAGHIAPVEHLMFSPDGKRIQSMGREKKILDWDLASGHETLRFQWSLGPEAGVWDHLIVSPRGDVVASWGHDDDIIRLWDTATGKIRRTLGKFPNGAKGSRFLIELDFSLDGRLLAIGTKDGMVSLWDVDAGVQREQLKGLAGQILCVAFSRDGKKIAAGTARGSPTIALWDVKTGKNLTKFSDLERVDRLAFSPDGKMLASATWAGGAPRLWDATTGRLIRPLASAPTLYDIAFSPDGKWLAGAGADEDQKVHVWEVTTGVKVRTFRGHIGPIMSIAFAPDSRTLASGGGDSSILLWDFTGQMKDDRLQIVKWTPRELEQRWNDLASGNGPRAVQAFWDLVASPEQTVPLFRQRTKPAEPADALHVERLIRDLDSDDFQTRTKATEELEKVVDQAESVLSKKLAEKPSLEMRQRIQQVLSKLEPSASAERLRMLRAIQILEYVGTSEAKEHLRTLAKGVPHARLTLEAKAALERLAK